jgi:hypothetical protein
MKTYKFSQTQEVKTNFEAYFGVSFGQFYDGFMSVLTKSIKIDIIKFDEYLHKKHGQYENLGLSMEKAICKYYSKEADQFINSLI